MKVEVSPTPKKFEPITLTITFETRDELLDMYARHAFGNREVVKLVRSDTRGCLTDVMKVVGKDAVAKACSSMGAEFASVPILVALEKEILS